MNEKKSLFFPKQRWFIMIMTWTQNNYV